LLQKELSSEYDAIGKVIKTYGWKPDTALSTDSLFLKIGAEYYWFHNDHLGTPQKITTSSGAVVWSAKYSSFGKAIIEIETVENNLRFPGQYKDDETGLYYNYHRYYDPGVGRYLKVDPIHHFNGLEDVIPYFLAHLLITPHALNDYSYSKINPLKNIDPKGLACGPGKAGDKLISDTPHGCDFSECCQTHDDCYDGFNQPCKPFTRKECDRVFLLCMLIKNPKLKCIHSAIQYYLSVHIVGWTRY